MFKKSLIYLTLVTFLNTILHATEVSNETFLIRDAYFKSYAHEAKKEYSEAIQSLQRLHQKYPTGYTLNLRIGYLYYLKKEYNFAIKHYQRASKTLPNSNEAKLGLTRVYLAQKSYKKAEKLAFAMLKTDYYSFYGNLYAIEALVGQEEYKTALAIINKMLAIFPTNITYLEQLALLYQKTNHQYLNDVYESIYILDPDNALLKRR